MIEEIRELSEEAKSVGIASVVWSYPRGGMLSKEGETASDICAYAAHLACLIGAHIVKVKPPTAALFLDPAKKVYEDRRIDLSSLSSRVPCGSIVLQWPTHGGVLRWRGQGPRGIISRSAADL